MPVVVSSTPPFVRRIVVVNRAVPAASATIQRTGPGIQAFDASV